MRATYRLQINQEFRISHVQSVLAYLNELGVSHLYLSPLLEACQGSGHGYDVINPTVLDGSRTTNNELAGLAEAAHRRSMSLMLDIVPNHLATSLQNPFWRSFLMYGSDSRYASWFDVDYLDESKTVIPLLDKSLEQAVESGDLRVEFDIKEGFGLRYQCSLLPFDPRTLPNLLWDSIAKRPLCLKPDVDALAMLVSRLASLPLRGVCADLLEALTHDLRSAVVSDPTLLNYMEGLRITKSRLWELIHNQHYRLIPWRKAGRRVNYRRFFDVNELVGIAVDRDEVFHATHELLKLLIENGTISALRVDHIDGLRDPLKYLEMLSASGRALGRQIPIYVEKVLTPRPYSKGEVLPPWPIDGTTGYEFGATASELLHCPEGVRRLDSWFGRMTNQQNFGSELCRSKRRVLLSHFGAELKRLARVLLAHGVSMTPPVSISAREAMRVLVEFIARFPAYRTYWTRRSGFSAADVELVATALEELTDHFDTDAQQLMYDCLLGSEGGNENFIIRLQQLTAPAAAKGQEDTAFYRYVPLASRNEVGNNPALNPSNATERFHDANRYRAQHWPNNMLAIDTHDTKRSGDLRARLAVLSEITEEWIRRCRRWKTSQSSNLEWSDEFLFYQSLVGAWPLVLSGPAPLVGDTLSQFRERLETYMLKAVREAKVMTSWVNPNEVYERTLRHFISTAMDPFSPLLSEAQSVVECIWKAGVWNSLVMTAWQFTVPGIPDIYQGSELLSYCFVDPDNRRPINYNEREERLEKIIKRWDDSSERPLLFRDLCQTPGDGECKQFLIWRLLAQRERYSELYASGLYRELSGNQAAIIGYQRSVGQLHLIVIARRLFKAIDSAKAVVAAERILASVSKDVATWQSVLTGESAIDPVSAARQLTNVPLLILQSTPLPP